MCRLIDLNKVKRRGHITGAGAPVKFVMNMDEHGKTQTPGFSLKSFKKMEGFVMEDKSVDCSVAIGLHQKQEDERELLEKN